ncbi:hypothetical protein QM787_03970 [Rhodococcus ruber]|uniref:Uncharacterized protein n=1 Tax=Rhodococcus ruber TaxID=1830 RepID=A0A098BU68_9NOCA|nr:hypothetical protein [Rhodococcus ruber]MCD2127658.1 hypothetical protein [Rhodococcus ruber]MCZ4504314.1 hypothetical protein [Rhodococcus ruber]MCZ4529450.1 hypothetical protein [Rhodococcus ruber]MCZ4620975.1 hypothetical protein [Rhodococcus ruber]MDI9966999.1 hypothetical protein [Rhodococcus ruber]
MTGREGDRIEVDRIAMHAADAAYMMVDPHPKGYILTTASRVRRALYAYEWAKTNKRPGTRDGYFYLPDPGEVRAAVLEYEAADE